MSEDFEVGYNVPAVAGMDEADIQTPCLIVDLDAFEENVAKMRGFCQDMGVDLRAHGKMHKSADVAKYQIEHGKAVGICCQKVSEAEAFARAGISDILVSNQIRDPLKIARLARLAKKVRITCCVDDAANVSELSVAAQKHETTIECLVEIDCGSGRCGVSWGAPVVDIAKAISAAPGLAFSGIQAYQGTAQHVHDYGERTRLIEEAIRQAGKSAEMLKAAGLACPVVTGGGTGSYRIEGASGVYTELQCGSYAFMDAHYRRIEDDKGGISSEFKPALFLLTSVISNVKKGRAICDAGLKVQAVDSGLPTVMGSADLEFIECSDEHGVIADPGRRLNVNDKLRLIPGHCDPTCNLHDWYVGVRGGKVEVLWPVTARGMAL